MIARTLALSLRTHLDLFPVVGLLGPRQVGKTTLAIHIRDSLVKPSTYLDLELDSDLAKLAEPELYLRRFARRLLILDEIQRRPELFPLLRGIVDQRLRDGERPPFFLVLGSASRDLLQQSSESLAGRIGYVELSPFCLDETGVESIETLWLRGGFPGSFLAPSDDATWLWRGNFLSTYLERDLPQLGFQLPAANLRRLWSMLAHMQGQTLNSQKLAGGLGLTNKTVRRYIDILSDLFMLRQLRPWSSNTGKRTVKRPKVYLRDSGLLHRLAQIRDAETLLGHPVCGHSWEGFVVENLITRAGEDWQPYFYRSAGGAELDLLMLGPRGERIAIEIKRTLSPRISRGFRSACDDVGATHRYFVIPTSESFPLDARTEAVGPCHDFLSADQPTRR